MLTARREAAVNAGLAAFERAEDDRDRIIADARTSAETIVRDFMRRNEKHLLPFASVESAREWIEENLLSLVELPVAHEAQADAEEEHAETEDDIRSGCDD